MGTSEWAARGPGLAYSAVGVQVPGDKKAPISQDPCGEGETPGSCCQRGFIQSRASAKAKLPRVEEALNKKKKIAQKGADHKLSYLRK